MGKGGKEKQKDEEDLTAAELASELEEDYDEDDPRSTEQFGLGYQSTMMYGYYSRQLGEFARMQSKMLGGTPKKKKRKPIKKGLKVYRNRCLKSWFWLWRNTLGKIAEEWMFLSILGISMGILVHLINAAIGACNNGRNWMQGVVSIDTIAAQYFAFVSLPVTLICFAAALTSVIGPQANGSGMPEIKTVLRGVTLKGFFDFNVLFAKVIGIVAVIGGGMPLGKEGPLVHIACMMCVNLSRLVRGFKGIYRSRQRTHEMLSAACALGVATCFSAPVGGVLFSVEATTSYFFVRNYFRGFLAAVWGCLTVRLLAVWCLGAPTTVAQFRTNFAMEYAFDAQEIFVYALIGLCCGLGSAAYVQIHRNFVLFMKNNKTISSFKKKYKFAYPAFISLLVASVLFPPGIGKYLQGGLGTGVQMQNLFSNFTWSAGNLTVAQQAVVNNWQTETSGIFCHLSVFLAFEYFFSILAVTMPVPAGMFVPLFKIGAAFGRIIGELMHIWYPDGIHYFGKVSAVVPGGYAIVGAASFVAGTTHTISVAMIAVELSGESTHLLPILIAILLSNAVATLLSPSNYESIIMLKNLPYLPDLMPAHSSLYSVYAEDFMVRDVKYVYHRMTYGKLMDVLKENREIRCFPLVDNPESMILLGSIQRMQLINLVEKHIGTERRRKVVAMRIQEREERAKLEELEKQRASSRKSSRFEVVPTEEVLVVKPLTPEEVEPYRHQSLIKKPSPLAEPMMPSNAGFNPYTTIFKAEEKVKSKFSSWFSRKKKKASEEDEENEEEAATGLRVVETSKGPLMDMTPSEQRAWEHEQLHMPVDFNKVRIDPAPFQLIERTSLIKVHTMFNITGVQIAFVTKLGRLVGLVGVEDLKKAVEDAKAGKLEPHELKITVQTKKAVRKTKRKNANDSSDENEGDNESEHESLICKV